MLFQPPVSGCWTLNNMCAYFLTLPWRETIVLALSNDQRFTGSKAARQAVPELGITFPFNLSRWSPSSKCAHQENENRETFFSWNTQIKEDVCSQADSCKNCCQGCSLRRPKEKVQRWKSRFISTQLVVQIVSQCRVKNYKVTGISSTFWKIHLFASSDLDDRLIQHCLFNIKLQPAACWLISLA